MNVKELGLRIKTQRERCRLKQADIAHALQISAQAVSQWERGENAPDIAVLLDLAKVLGVTTDWILGRNEPLSDTFEATVFCTDMQGFAHKAARLPPRDLAAWTNGIFHLLTEAVLRHEGVPVKYVGDGFLAFFSGARHAERALRAARHARTVVPRSGMDIALHAGEIYLGAMGHRDYARPDIMGQTVNTAFLSLQWAARHAPEQLVVTGQVAALLQKPGADERRDYALHRIREGPRGRVPLKGVPGGLELYVLKNRKGS